VTIPAEREGIRFGPNRISAIRCEAIDHYIITRRVLEDPEAYMARLLGDEP
jgi:hypothetical protein